MAITEPRGGEGSAICARGGDTSSRRSLQSWPRTSTTVPHGDRGRPGQREEREKNYTATLRRMPLPGTLRWTLGKDVGEAPAAGRPAPLLEVLPQERVQQRTAEQIADLVPLVPLLHDVVPKMVEQLVDILSPLDFRVPEQVIEVPKIVCPPRAARTVLGAPQTVGTAGGSAYAFQFALGVVLVDVFKIFSLDIFPPRLWSRSQSFQFLIMVFLEVSKVFTQHRVQQRVRSRSLTFQFLMAARISKILVSHRFLKKLLEKRFKGFLALFHGGKSAKIGPHSAVGTECGLWFIHAARSFRPVLGG